MSIETQEIGQSLLRDIIGTDYFDKRTESTNPFNAEIRALSEEYCFGTIWSRPGLSLEVRSLICIATLVALGKSNELALHVGGAIRNGCSTDQIKEVLLQSMIYCGLPAAVDGFKVAENTLREMGEL